MVNIKRMDVTLNNMIIDHDCIRHHQLICIKFQLNFMAVEIQIVAV